MIKRYLEYIKESHEIGQNIYLILSEDKQWVYNGYWGSYDEGRRGRGYTEYEVSDWRYKKFININDLTLKKVSGGLAVKSPQMPLKEWVFDNEKDAQKVLNKLIEINKSEKGHIDNSGYTRANSWKFWKKLGTGKREEFNPNPIVVEYFFGLFPTGDLI